jgi:integrase
VAKLKEHFQNSKLKLLIDIIEETGMRLGEAYSLKWTNINLQTGLVSFATEKSSNPRYVYLSPSLIEKLKKMPREGERLFNATRSALSSNFYQQRKRLSIKLNDPYIREISFQSFRHKRITDIANETRDTFATMAFSGHKDMKSAQGYIHLSKILHNIPKPIDRSGQLFGFTMTVTYDCGDCHGVISHVS